MPRAVRTIRAPRLLRPIPQWRRALRAVEGDLRSRTGRGRGLTEGNMRYIVILSLAAGLQISASEAQAPMSPSVKAQLCKLAKRDAALSPAEVEAIRQARSECLAAPQELGPIVEKCKSRVDTWRKLVLTECTSTQTYKPKNCSPDYPATADKRMAMYCTEE